MNYTTIHHGFRHNLGISTDEYCVLDLIYCLSTNPSAPVPGWCIMKKEAISGRLKIPIRTLTRFLKNLESLKLIERSGRKIRTTKAYHRILLSFQESAKVADQISQSGRYIYNNIDNNSLSLEDFEKMPLDHLKDICDAANLLMQSPLNDVQRQDALSTFHDHLCIGRYGPIESQKQLRLIFKKYLKIFTRYELSNKSYGSHFKNLSAADRERMRGDKITDRDGYK